MNYVEAPELVSAFVIEARALVEGLEKAALGLERDRGEGQGPGLLAEVKRLVHTLKGNAGLLGASTLKTALHAVEERLEGAPERAAALLLAAADAVAADLAALEVGGAVAEAGLRLAALLARDGARASAAPEAARSDDQSVSTSAELRISAARIDGLVAAAGELLVHQGRLQRFAAERADPALRALIDPMETVARRLHGEVLRARMVPLTPVLTRHTRLVRDEAARAGKQARLEVRSDGVELDKAVIDAVSPALVHLIRNAVAHGLELPAARLAAGKPAEGRVRLRARAHGATVELTCEDDGGGLDRAALTDRARALGLDPSSPAEELIFVAGLSTAPLGETAGRGVGMDAVRRAVTQVGGTLSVQSQPGAGSCFTLRLPASVALQRVLLFELGAEVFALPSASVDHAVRLSAAAIRWAGAGHALEDRGGLVPLLDPVSALGATAGTRFALVVEAGGLAAIPVDGLLGHHELVIHPVEAGVRGAGPVLGATLAPNGAVVLQLDPHALVTFARRGGRPSGTEARA